MMACIPYSAHLSVDGDFIYGVCGFGELRCLDAKTGDRVWETYAATGGHKGIFRQRFFDQAR